MTKQVASKDGILVVDNQGSIVYFNQCFLDMWRISPRSIEQKFGHECEEFLLRRVAEPKDIFQKFQKICENFQEEYHDSIKLADGRTFDYFSSPLIARDGQPPCRLWRFQVMSSEVETGEQWLESEARFRAIFEGADIGMTLVDIQGEGQIIEGNPALTKMLGYTRDELEGMTFNDFTHPEDIEPNLSFYREAIAGKRDHYKLEKRYFQKGGGVLWANLTASVVRDPAGAPRYVIGMLEDITARKMGELFRVGQNRVLKLLATGTSLEIVLTAILETIEEQTPKTLSSILIIDPLNNCLRHGLALNLPEEYIKGIDGIPVKSGAGSCGTAAHRGECVITDDTYTDPLWKDYRELAKEHGLRACWSQPIFSSSGKILGTFAIYSREARSPTVDELRLVETAANLAGISIGNKHEQEELAKAQALLLAAIEQSPAGIIVADAPDVRIRIVNQAALGIRGSGKAPALSDIPLDQHPSKWQTFHPDGTLCAPENLPLSQAVLHGKTSENVEVIIRRPGGEKRWVLANAAPVRNAKGEEIAGVVVFSDITERKRDQKALEAIVKGTCSETGGNFFRSVSRHLASALHARYVLISECMDATKNRVRTQAFWNGECFVPNFEYNVNGTPCGDILKGHLCYYPRDVQSHFPEDHDLGKLGAVSYLGIPLFDSAHQLLGHLCVLDDKPMDDDPREMSILKVFAARIGAELERKKTLEALREAKEAAEVANRSKSEFLSQISHEIRNPLHGILSFAAFGFKNYETANVEKLREYFLRIEQSGKTLLSLVNDLLDLSKLEAGMMNFEFIPGVLCEVIDSVVREFSELASSRGISISRRGSTDRCLTGDWIRIKQVVSNLLSNALKFSPNNSEIEITVDQEENTTRISVKDQGPGIPKEELQLVFNKFIQASTNTSRIRGTGLGLSICREIVTAHNGKIWAKNNPEKGANFTLELPLEGICEHRHKLLEISH